MAKRITFPAILTLVALLLAACALCAMPAKAYAQIASGTSGGCTWVIDEAGILTIKPTDGASGTLDNWGGGTPSWLVNRDYITSVEIKPGVSAVTCHSMFADCKDLAYVDLSRLDVAKVSDMSNMFDSCKTLVTANLFGWDTRSVTNMSCMFFGCEKIDTIVGLKHWDTAGVTDMSRAFAHCGNLDVLDLASWDTSSVTSMYSLFSYCRSLRSLGVSSWDTSKVSNMQLVFGGCESLSKLDVSGWDTSSATDMSSMFAGCASLAEIDVSGWDTSHVTRFSGMFDGCKSLSKLDVSGWDTSSATKMQSVFDRCESLTSLDLSGWDTSRVTRFSNMFDGCASLATIYASEAFTTAAATDYADMFAGCTSLKGGLGTTLATTGGVKDKTYARIDKAGQPGYFTRSCNPSEHDLALIEALKAPTCVEAGFGHYKCKVCSRAFDRVVPALGHAFGDPSITFADDNMAATAFWACTRQGCMEAVTSECAVTFEVTQAASCTEPEVTTYAATAAADPDKGLVGGTAVKSVETAPAKGHSFVDGVCSVCGEKEPKPASPASTGDALPTAALMGVAAVAGAVLAIRRKLAA